MQSSRRDVCVPIWAHGGFVCVYRCCACLSILACPLIQTCSNGEHRNHTIFIFLLDICDII